MVILSRLGPEHAKCAPLLFPLLCSGLLIKDPPTHVGTQYKKSEISDGI